MVGRDILFSRRGSGGILYIESGRYLCMVVG